ncbi:NAD(+)-dependent deacetylase [Cavenderia fasciculata]|uniref:NAD(+)-dependent deacetylase n=1 Tax=Cavenderia fasciculata TaxID=261658 RepID=F4Q4Y0_CACFS|nr:NAD(+)-dependent deacetylase [Cavenderia fasciculata]EGG17086.1 NAD(+)-dependent deacetylase [Cavenderia fasciculata]|eukprot:XP_004355570.1 NAD(+)-dependent deacetylase [Cavenderia fasciculata]
MTNKRNINDAINRANILVNTECLQESKEINHKIKKVKYTATEHNEIANKQILENQDGQEKDEQHLLHLHNDDDEEEEEYDQEDEDEVDGEFQIIKEEEEQNNNNNNKDQLEEWEEMEGQLEDDSDFDYSSGQFESSDDSSSSESDEDSELGSSEKQEIINSKLKDDPNLDIYEFAKNLIIQHINEKKSQNINPKKFTKDLGFTLQVDEEDEDPWELITSFLTKRKIALHLFFKYMKYQSFSRPYRRKLEHINTIDDVVNLFKTCKNILIITGAGVSVSSGIPDFRSKGGVYETIEKKYNLPEPECLFDIHYLLQDPNPFFEFAKEIYPGRHKPSPTHYFIKELDERGLLLRNYTQNIDTLEHVAGISHEKLVNCHGSFSTASCISCKFTVDCSQLRETIDRQQIPYCQQCDDSKSFMKPNIVFFGENLPDRFDHCVREDRPKVDMVIVMGSSLKVQPVSLLPEYINPNVPQILINREIVGQPHQFDYAYLGDCDTFVKEMKEKLNWF